MAHIGIPGGIEWLTIFFIGFFGIGMKLAFMVFVIVFLIKINSSIESVKKKLDQFEQKR
ncbi:MAG: hypothetical protein KBI46_07035 [Phycisphaerae bacterium]|nr:hypothetical protein [Phycisphaerae bacterium]